MTEKYSQAQLKHFGEVLNEMIRKGLLKGPSLHDAVETWAAKTGAALLRQNVPSLPSIYRYVDGISFSERKVFVLCAYFLYRRLGGYLPEAYELACNEMMAAMFEKSYDEISQSHLSKVKASDAIDGSREEGCEASLSAENIDRIVSLAICSVRAAQAEIYNCMAEFDRAPDIARRELQVRKVRRDKDTTNLDQRVERAAEAAIKAAADQAGLVVDVEGEESLKDYEEFPGWDASICALVDALDGTELITIGVDLWCSAVLLWDRGRRRVVASAVAIPGGKVCVAREDRRTAWISKHETDISPGKKNLLRGCSQVADLFHSHIAAYGQKPNSFLSIVDNVPLIAFLREALRRGAQAKVRFYNFAGNPVIVRLADVPAWKNHSIRDGVDIVIENRGQVPHDFAPGAFIALQMGASMWDIGKDRKVTLKELGDMIAEPLEPVRYIIAATEALRDHARTVLCAG